MRNSIESSNKQKLLRYLSILDVFNCRQQPNRIVDCRHLKNPELIDGFNSWPESSFAKDDKPIWLIPKVFDFIYKHKKITFFSYKYCEALLILYKGRLVYEKYYGKWNAYSKYKMYSMTKTIIALLLGVAIDENYIKSVDEPVIDFFPETEKLIPKDSLKRNMSIRHLITMTSGLTDGFYWRNSNDTGLYGFLMPQNYPPGKKFQYLSVNYQIVSCIINRATKCSIYEYANEKIFKPLGINNVVWNRMKDNSYQGNGGITLNAYDMLKIGYLLQNYGKWKDKQIVSADYIIQSTSYSAAPKGFGSPFWNNSFFPFFLGGSYETRGHNGQFITVYPHLKLVIFRAGWAKRRVSDEDNSSVLAGQIYVISNEYNKREKNAICSYIKTYGGKIRNKVNKKTAFIVVKNIITYKSKTTNPSTPIIDENELINMVKSLSLSSNND